MGSLSIWHWLIVLLIVVLVFGTKKLRNMGGDVGGAVKDFKDAVNEGKAALEKPVAAAAVSTAKPKAAAKKPAAVKKPAVAKKPVAAKKPAAKKPAA